MLKPHQALLALSSIEALSEGQSIIHRVHPLTKITLSLLYITLLASVNKYDNIRLLCLSFYPISVMIISRIPLGLMLSRLILVLPFPIFAGLSNLFFENSIAGYFLSLPITHGLLSFLSILLKAILSVMTLITLTATTPLDKLANQLAKMKVPKLFLSQLIFTYRYLGTLLFESRNMLLAYHLRSPKAKGISLKHSGSFLGSLLLRSFDRAERIYAAMKCRGFDAGYPTLTSLPLSRFDYLYGFLTGGTMIFCRLFHF